MIKKLLPLAGLTALLVPGTGLAEPPIAPTPRPVTPTIHNLTWTYSDMRTVSVEEFETLVRDLPADRLQAVLSALKVHRAEIGNKEAILQERLKAKHLTPHGREQK